MALRRTTREVGEAGYGPELYLSFCHEPYQEPPHPQPINTTIVHAATLLNVHVPRPDGPMMYRCLIEAPGRRPGEIVPLSTLTYELDGGVLWHKVADRDKVTTSVLAVIRAGECDALSLRLDDVRAILLAQGPNTAHRITDTNTGQVLPMGPVDRARVLDTLTGHLHQAVATEGPLRHGQLLVDLPKRPRRMPYKPRKS